MINKEQLLVILLIIAILAQFIGGILDITRKKELCLNNLCITKQYLWADSIFLVLIIIVILLIK
jgi:hypothetical protein